MQYQYQIEYTVPKRRKRRIIVYICILLFVLFVGIGFGILAAKKVKQGKEDIKENTLFNMVEERKDRVPQKEEKPLEIQRMIAQQELNNLVKNVSNIYDGTEGKRVFLTFDDGPSNAVTPHILDTLKKYNIKATFFVLGSRVRLAPSLIKREYDEGHYIANHGYSHKYSKIYASSNDVLKEYNKTENEIKKALGNTSYSSHLFRFPGGSVGGQYNKIKKEAKKELKKQQIAYLDWNALTSDAAGANTKEKILKNMKKTVGNHHNVVILMHDAPDKILTYETLEEVIRYLQEKGYAFKSMYDLM